MKKYVVCGDCGRKLCKAEPGSVVELVCPKCKKARSCDGERGRHRNA